jgi:hypothetical protein
MLDGRILLAQGIDDHHRADNIGRREQVLPSSLSAQSGVE